MQLNYLKSRQLNEGETHKLLIVLKMLSQVHVILGIVMVILSALADYVSSRINTIRLNGLIECCSFYFIVMGFVMLFGAVTYRRGLIIAGLVMSFHAVLIFVPGIVIVSSFDIHFYKHECWGSCDWHLLAALPNNSQCQILCGENVDDHIKGRMTRLGTDYRLDAALIALACVELLLAIASLGICLRVLCSRISTITVTEMVPLNERPNVAENTNHP